MKFRHYLRLTEDVGPPMGGMGAPPMGGPPGGMGGGPPMGGPPMGAPPPPGGMGGAPPMGGMEDPMGGGMGGAPPMGAPPSEPPVIPRHADVWDVLDAILNKKSLDHEQKYQQAQTAKDNKASQNPMGDLPPSFSAEGGPMGGGMGGPPMGAPPQNEPRLQS